MKLAEKLLRGSTLSLLDMLVKTVALFLMMPLMKSRLGLEGWGTWLVSMSFVNWFVLLDAGATFAGTRFLAAAWGRGDSTRAGTVLRLLKRFFFWIAAFTGLASIVMAALSLWWPWPQGSNSTVLLLTGTCGLAIAMRFICRRGPIILRARVRYDWLAGISILRVACQNGGMAWLLWHGGSLWQMALVYLVSDLLETSLQWLAARRLGLSDEQYANPALLPELAKEMMSFSVLMVIAVIGETLRMQVGPALLAGLAGVASVPIFTVGTRLITMIEDVVNALFGGQLLAAFSQVHGAGGGEALNRQVLRVTIITSGFATFAMSGATIYGRAFIMRLLGGDMSEAFSVFLLLAPGFLLRFMQYPAHSALYSLGKQKPVILMTLTGASMGSLASIPAVHWLGARGVAAAFGCEMVICYSIVFPLIVRHVLQLSLRHYLLQSLFRPAVLVAMPLLGFGLLVQGHVRPDYAVLALLASGHTLIFICTAPWLLFDGVDRQLVLSRFPRFRTT
jgi:O-antigen/teichoic acid export membrane protein